MNKPSFVVTGGAQGVGRTIVERLAEDGSVIVLDIASRLEWADPGVQLVSGDGRGPVLAQEAAARAEVTGPLSGWVNNAAIFRDAGLASASAQDLLEIVTANL